MTQRERDEAAVGECTRLAVLEREHPAAATRILERAIAFYEATEYVECGRARHHKPPHAIIGCDRGCVTECVQS